MSDIHPLLWCDIETTGLDPATDETLEVTLALTTGDPSLEVLEVLSYVRDVDPLACYELSSEYVQRMHSESGLWAALDAQGDGSDPGRAKARDDEFEARAIRLLRAAGYTKPGPIAGNSPHFDRAFLRVQLPGLSALFNHRVFDVSTLTHCLDLWGQPRYKTDRAAHRSEADIMWSIGQARAFLSLGTADNSLYITDTGDVAG